MMIGGYFSFQGINGGARWHKTPVEEVLPVDLPADRRPGRGAGRLPRRAGRSPSIRCWPGLDGEWPVLLGLNEVVLKDAPGVELLARAPADAGGHPLLAVGTHGKGRTLAWTSDIGPHWLPDSFVAWPGYARLWRQALQWVTRSA